MTENRETRRKKPATVRDPSDKDYLLRTSQALAILKDCEALSRDDIRQFLRDNVPGFDFLVTPEELVQVHVIAPPPEVNVVVDYGPRPDPPPVPVLAPIAQDEWGPEQPAVEAVEQLPPLPPDLERPPTPEELEALRAEAEAVPEHELEGGLITVPTDEQE